MKTTNQQKADALFAQAKAFVEAHEDDKGLLSAEDQVTFDAMLAGVETLRGGGLRTQARVNRHPPTIQGAERGTALVDERGHIHRGLTPQESFADAIQENPELFHVTDEEQKVMADGLTIGGYMRSLVAGPRTSAERWALSESSGSGGGYTVPSFLAALIIDKFRARQVLVRAGAQTLPLEGDSHTFATLTGDATAAWRREENTIAESQQTFGAITFYPKSLAVLVKVTRELLQDSPNIGQAIDRSLTAAMAVEVDRVGLLGAGGIEPLGLKNWPELNEIAGVGAIADYSDFVDAEKLMLDDNTPDPTAAIISNREWSTLAKLEDTTGQPLMIPSALEGLPFLTTSALPTNLGGGANESNAFVGYYPDLIFGVRLDLQIEVLKELFAQTHHYAYVAHLRMDVGVFHAESFVRLLGITP